MSDRSKLYAQKSETLVNFVLSARFLHPLDASWTALRKLAILVQITDDIRVLTSYIT